MLSSSDYITDSLYIQAQFAKIGMKVRVAKAHRLAALIVMPFLRFGSKFFSFLDTRLNPPQLIDNAKRLFC